MKKLVTILFVFAFVGVFFNSCKEDEHCIECVITIAGIEEDKGQTCGSKEEIDNLEAEYQDIVDRENSIVGQSASRDCIRYILP